MNANDYSKLKLLKLFLMSDFSICIIIIIMNAFILYRNDLLCKYAVNGS